ncbi:poly(3-hydroxyalkanoate) synthetase [Beggiatoa alba B18LD]|uniref:Poly(3-hydroxyalkanoate) synthetase n=1 Tax=Beggiatoa alba B18LD TaxID=395493 RepID=I3CDK2_9GAMM|nr:poly(3-hydroxyalkanoate) synthetase [Beggiatoa alba]EIJ41695.1 poly(3-hydroxyalkanoate) synthetase [Beggiatoa alba B18LD]
MSSSLPPLNELSVQINKLLEPFGISQQDFMAQFGNFFDPFGLFSEKSEAVAKNLLQSVDPFGITQSYLDVQRAWLNHPKELSDCLLQLSKDSWAIQLQTWERFSGFLVQDSIPVNEYDERFQEPEWTENPYLDTIKEIYLLYTRWIEDSIYKTPDLPEKTRDKAGFWMRQVLNAISPSNYFWTNPVAVQRFVETGGESLLKGLKNFIIDSKYKTIRMVDNTAFTVGGNLANTVGSVVYRSPLFELIQYKPVTANVHQVPLLIVPPWINKFYVLDLGEQKSFVHWLVAQGYTVFLISWKNPTAEMRHTSLDDYMLKGVLEAANIAKQITNAPHVHAVGYCIGGIILTALMAWLDADDIQGDITSPIQSWSLFTTLVDFSNPGEIKIFIDEETIKYIEELMSEHGYLPGSNLADSFRMLRSNSLIWHYYVHNYLYGEDLPQFDVLAWNMDSTRLPEAMHSFYLREFYLHNKFMQPKGITLGGRSLDVRKISQPLYAVGTEQDHIAPWKETFKICGLVKSPVRYVLATSGHILGIISPPVNPPKRRYWVGDATGQSDAEAWVAATPKVPGSWWEDWDKWLGQHCGEMVVAPSVGNQNYPALCPAPGTYVLEK